MRSGMRVLLMWGALIVLGASAASAATPGQKCQSAKNQEAGRYAACLAKTEAKLLTTAGTCSVTTATVCFGDGECPMGQSCTKPLTPFGPAVTKCTNNFTEHWNWRTQKASHAGDPCPDGLESTEIQDAIDQHVGNIAAALRRATDADESTRTRSSGGK